jgi:hypothetical protein
MGVVGATHHLDSNSFDTYHMKHQSCGSVEEQNVLSADSPVALLCAHLLFIIETIS